MDNEPPNATEARLIDTAHGLRLEVDAADGAGGCGIVEVRASIVGPGVLLDVDLHLAQDPGGTWFSDISADRCGTPGEVWLGFLALRDDGGNEREFRYARGESYLQATDRNIELPFPTATLDARRPDPVITEVVGVAPGQIEVSHDGTSCAVAGGWLHATGPDGDTIRLEHEGSLAPGRELFSVPSTQCLAGGAWRVDEAVVRTEFGGGGVFAPEDAPPTFDVPDMGLTERRTLQVEGLRLISDAPGAAKVIVELSPGSCPLAALSGEVRRLATGDDTIHRAYFDDDGVATLADCAGAGVWWIERVVLRDVSGGIYTRRLRVDDPSLGYREDSSLEPPTLESPF